MTTKTYNGIRTGFGCKVDEDLHGGPDGSILVVYYECNSVAEAASSMKLSPEAVQRILDAFDNIIEAINRMIEWAAQAIRTIADFFGETLDNFILRRAPPKWRHYALHAKRARVRKKYRNRIRRAFFAALASEGGGSS